MFCFDCSTHRVQYNLSALKLTPRKTTDEGSTVKTTTLNVSAARQRIVQRSAISPAFLSIRQKDELVSPLFIFTPPQNSRCKFSEPIPRHPTTSPLTSWSELLDFAVRMRRFAESGLGSVVTWGGGCFLNRWGYHQRETTGCADGEFERKVRGMFLLNIHLEQSFVSCVTMRNSEICLSL